MDGRRNKTWGGFPGLSFGWQVATATLCGLVICGASWGQGVVTEMSGPTAPVVNAAATMPAPAVVAVGTGEEAASRPAGVRSALESMPIRQGKPTGGEAGDVGAGTNGAKGTPGWYGMVQVMGALGVVVGLIYVGRALARKFVPGAAVGNAKGVIEVLARQPITKGQAVVLVRIGSQIVALAQGRERSESILVISEQTEVAKILGQIQGTKATSIQAGFSKLMANAQMELEQGEGEEKGGESLAHANKLLSSHRTAAKGRITVEEDVDAEVAEMAAAKRQLLELRKQVRQVRERLPG